MERVLRLAESMGAKGEPGALCTIVATRGSVPAPAGARMLVRGDGTFAGTVGGGCLEHDVWAAARRVLDDGQARCISIDLTDYEAQEAGLACGGSLEVLVEAVTAPLGRAVGAACDAAEAGVPVSLCHRRPEGPWFVHPLNGPQLVILGGGHVGRAIDAAVRPCGWQTIVIDDRADFASADRFPASRCIVAPFDRAFDGIAVHPSTAVLVVTRGHRYDAEALRAALATGAGYVGLIGSARKILTVYEQLLEQGVAAERLEQVFAPIGSEIGAETPAEIAAAVAAELVAVRRLGPEAALALNPKAARVRESFRALLEKRRSS